MSINKEILFRRRGAVLAPINAKLIDAKVSTIEPNATKSSLLVTASVNIGSLGYRFSEDFFKAALNSKLSVSDFAAYLSEVIAILRAATGESRKYAPMYPNFPAQVIEAYDLELNVNALVHYYGSWLGVRIMPEYVAVERESIEDVDFSNLIELRVVGVTKRGLSATAATAEFNAIFNSLLSMQGSWGAAEREDAKWFLKNTDASTLATIIPENIPNKENLAAVVVDYLALQGADSSNAAFRELLNRAATATDVLRIAVGLSGGDVTLSGVGVEKVRFVSQPKAVRRILLGRLEEIADGRYERLVEDMLRNSALWKLLSHSLHAGEYAKQFPSTATAVKVIRSNGKNADGSRFSTFGTKVEALINAAELTVKKESVNGAVISDLVGLLSSRPGVFARRLDKVLRSAADKDFVVSAFGEVAASVATPVLWQLRNFYTNRHLVSGKSTKLSRSFLPKGRATSLMTAKNPLPKLNDALAQSVIDVIDEAIRSIYSTRAPLGKVFIDDELSNYTVPFGARSASKTLNPVGRGTRGVVNKDAKTLRFFIFWKDGDTRVDLDLTAMFLTNDFAPAGAVSYYNLRDSGAVHSGDITSAPKGAAEFIDIDRIKTLANGRRYVAMVVNSYTHQKFDTLPEVFAGVMEISGNAQKGQIFEPRRVNNAFDVTTPSTMVVPLVIDLEDASFIWTDLAVGSNVTYANNVANNEDALSRSIRGLVESKMVSLHDVFTANAVRGELVSSADKADIVVSINRGRVMVNGEVVGTDRILSEWI